jgi:hypothetical protein
MRSGHRAGFFLSASIVLGASGAGSSYLFASGHAWPNSSSAQARCPVQGVWDLVSRTIDGKDAPLNGFRERKLLTARHYMWVGHADRRDTLPLNTELERLRALQFEGGAGTYTTFDSTYTEHIELYDNAREIGTSFKAKCRVTGDRWEHIFTIPNDTTNPSGRVLHFVQVYRRVE